MRFCHAHIRVPNLADSIRFYSALFAAEPAVVKSDDAKWMLDGPRVHFAISQRGAVPGLDHLGVQTENEAELVEMHTSTEQCCAADRQTRSRRAAEIGVRDRPTVNPDVLT